MARITEKQGRVLARLEEIRRRASEMNAAQKTKGGVTGAGLAEEAANLGIEIATELLNAKAAK